MINHMAPFRREYEKKQTEAREKRTDVGSVDAKMERQLAENKTWLLCVAIAGSEGVATAAAAQTLPMAAWLVTTSSLGSVRSSGLAQHHLPSSSAVSHGAQRPLYDPRKYPADGDVECHHDAVEVVARGRRIFGR